MYLTRHQIEKIDQTIPISPDKSIVLIDVSEETTLSQQENNANIYCVNSQYEIIWQVKDRNPLAMGMDMFLYISLNDNNELTADRFSGFEYKINTETGEAVITGFHK